MQCVVLAGGLGTRLYPLTRDLPKSLVPIHGRPFLDYQLRQLVNGGVTEVVLCIGYRGAQIRDYAGDGSRWGLSLSYVDEGESPSGTAYALRLAQPLLNDRFLVMYGDSFLRLNYAQVMSHFVAGAAPALMTVYPWRDGNAVFKNGRVVLYDKRRKAPDMRYIDFGVSAFRKGVPFRSADLADVFHRLSLDGDLAGLEVNDRFYEVGSPDGIRELTEFLREPSCPLPSTPPCEERSR